MKQSIEQLFESMKGSDGLDLVVAIFLYLVIAYAITDFLPWAGREIRRVSWKSAAWRLERKIRRK